MLACKGIFTTTSRVNTPPLAALGVRGRRVRGLPRGIDTRHLSRRQAMPGSSSPSMNSSEAPPPVEICVILSA